MLTVRAVAPSSAVALLWGMALWPADKVPSGLPPSSCQRSLGVQSREQKGLVYTYNSANLPGPGVYDPLQLIWITKQAYSSCSEGKLSAKIWGAEKCYHCNGNNSTYKLNEFKINVINIFLSVVVIWQYLHKCFYFINIHYITLWKRYTKYINDQINVYLNQIQLRYNSSCEGNKQKNKSFLLTTEFWNMISCYNPNQVNKWWYWIITKLQIIVLLIF